MMKTHQRRPSVGWLTMAMATLGVATAAAAPNPPQPPTGWTMTGDRSDAFTVLVDRDVRHEGPASAHLACQKDEVDGFGGLMQTIDAKRYRGKRVRLSGWVKGALEDGQWAGLWMRVDGPGSSRNTLAFDNMMDRRIQGASDWTRHEVVLDVPEQAVRVAFGMLVVRGGEIWVDELAFDEVDDDVPTTKPTKKHRFEPINLDFEKGQP